MNDSDGDSKWMDLLTGNGMTPADLRDLINQVKGEATTDDFTKALENVGILLNAVQQVRGVAGPGGGPGFLDALTAVVEGSRPK